MAIKVYGGNHGIATANVIPDNTSVALNIESADGKDVLTVDTRNNVEVTQLSAAGVAGLEIHKGTGDAEVRFADEIGFISDPNSMIRRNTSDYLEFRMAGTDILGVSTSGVFVENGNFGIGTLTPATKFECNGAATTIGAIATALTGTFTATNNDTAISSGSSTAFTTELHVGAAIKIGSEGTYTVAAIASDTALTLDSVFTGSTGASKSGTTDSGELFAVKTGDSKSILSVNAAGVLGLSTTPDATASSGNLLGIGDPGMFDAVTTALRTTIIGNCRDSKPFSFVSGDSSVLIGFEAGRTYTTASNTVAIGANCGDTASGTDNAVIIGMNAGRNAGDNTVYVGMQAGENVTGTNNVAIGQAALDASGSAASSVAVGYQSLTTATGNGNVGVGSASLFSCSGGSNNTAIGLNTGGSLTGGQKCILIGKGANVSGADVTDEIAIGCDLTGGGSDTARIGQSAVYMQIGIADGATPSWAATSDARIKDNITDTDLGLDFINAIRAVKHTVKNTQDWPEELRPDVDKEQQVTRSVKVTDEDGNESTEEQTVTIPARPRHADNPTINDGVIAQEVKAVCDAQGVTFSGWSEDTNGLQHVQYERFVMPLIKAVQELTARIATLEAGD